MRCLPVFTRIRMPAFFLGAISLFFVPLLAQNTNTPIPQTSSANRPVTGQGGMVATQEAHATRSALEVLAEGGNAVDAAVTAGFTLAVTLPRAGNLGGGGFMLIHLAKENRQIALDYREKAPSAAQRDMFLTKEGAPDPRRSRLTRLASGVPGTVHGLAHALRHYGSISIRRALAPAIKLAADGFVVGQALHDSLKSCADDLYADKEARSIFLNANGKAWPVGSTLVQKDLARSLRLLSEQGPAAF
ncbi:MAG TPA: gamma-glutamyltransferase, partial [Verrucomicrobiales bacterium]|nr:gamma-glutamyltransferase [Verrucomicrobiales bacterium]